jgi:hypothetical protein
MISGIGEETITYGAIPGLNVKGDWKNLKVVVNKIDTENSADEEYSKYVEIVEVGQIIKDLIKYQKEKANWYKNKASIMKKMKKYM